MEIEKVQKLVANLRDKTESIIHIGNLEQVSNHGLVIIIKWLSLIKMLGENYIDINTDLRKKAKNEVENIFFKLMNNSVFGKAMENVRKHRDIELVITEGRRNYLISEPNCHTTKFFTKNLLAIEMKKSG